METQRKIELQTPEDLAYLVANVRRAAAARIDEAIPLDPAHGEYDLRTQIEELVDEYITKTFTLASPNLSINGLPVDASQYLSPDGVGSSASASAKTLEPEEIYEPFDARKRARVEDLTREEEDLLRDIAALKKSVPGAAAAAWADATKKGVKADEEALAAWNERSSSTTDAAAPDGTTTATGAGRGIGVALGVGALERQQDVEATYEKAVQGLGRLRREMPAVVARMERARGAGEYVITER
ncbi:hypothetical protein F5Y15DRAFT_411354 [Xylariaceae sp. FL0016]|nr:hypothetical protein F5Y15DRAFT_411354 [Xylariaceae sp. FL0016]